MERISKHISYKEATRSTTSIRLGIDNKPFEYELGNMKATAENIFEPLRKWVGGAIKVTSFFRSEKLNQAIGGSVSSQHCQGRAIDIDDVYGYKTNAEMFNYIKNNLDFDNLIWEFGTDDNPDWIHVSYVSNERNRGQVLRAIKENGKTKYLNYE
jgi:zinc D-Ala-D-Ala carboxypeptidase